MPQSPEFIRLINILMWKRRKKRRINKKIRRRKQTSPRPTATAARPRRPPLRWDGDVDSRKSLHKHWMISSITFAHSFVHQNNNKKK
jgi:hypothetical protein